MSLELAAQGIYWSVQGEGHHAGTPMTFVRLAGCSVGCHQCDTNYRHHSTISEEEVVDRCVAIRDETGRGDYVWVTGGEPTDQDLSTLRSLLWKHEFKPCLATSGVRKVDGPWWVLSVSPHTPSFVQRSGSELKLVPGLNGLRIDEIDLSTVEFAYKFVQPLAGDRSSVAQCMDVLKRRRDFRMSPQYHKEWMLP